MTKAARIALGGAALAAAFALGRVATPSADCDDAATLDSFVRALEERNWLARSHGLSAFLVRLSPEELPGALDALERRRAWLAPEELRLFMLAWSRFDAPAAFERALSWPGRSRRAAAGAAIYAWAFYDPEAALRALERVEDRGLADFLRTRLVAGWVRSERFDDANRYVASLPEGAQRESLVGMLARDLNERGSEAVVGWAESVPDVLPSYKRTVFARATAALAASDPESAVRFAAQHAGREYARGSVAIIAGRWANLDPQAALGWLLGIPASAERDDAVADAFGRWLSTERTDAERWLGAATPARALDPAVRVVVRKTNQRGSPAEAIEWARRIEEPALRDEVVVAVARAWRRREPEAAAFWVGRSDLSEGLRAQILAPEGAGRSGGGS